MEKCFPKVSIIMGIYNLNNEAILRKSINSILSQSFTDFEFIICDDGSSDGTYELIKRLIENDDRVKLIRNEKNYGLATTLNKCLNLAEGEYIARMDADDYSHPDRIDVLINFLENNSEYSLVGSEAILFDDEGEWGYRELIEKPTKRDLLNGSPFIHPSIMIRKKDIDIINGYRISKETVRSQDYDLFMRLYANGFIGYNIKKPYLNFREDTISYKRKSYKKRIDEMKIRYYGFKQLNLLPIGYIYTIKPLIVGMIPQQLLIRLRNEKRVK